jgi:hypothetical protein
MRSKLSSSPGELRPQIEASASAAYAAVRATSWCIVLHRVDVRESYGWQENAREVLLT